MSSNGHLRPYVRAVGSCIARLDCEESQQKLLQAEARGFTPEELAFFEQLRREFVTRRELRPVLTTCLALLSPAAGRYQTAAAEAASVRAAANLLEEFLAGWPEESTP